MLMKRVKYIIRQRFNHFVGSIEDERIRNIVKNNTFVTGGAITSLLLDEEINDLDIYFTNNTSAVTVSEYLVGRYKATHTVPEHTFGTVAIREDGSGVDINYCTDYACITSKTFKRAGQADNYDPVSFSRNAITLVETGAPESRKPNVVQLITRFTGRPIRVHNNFDFVHCCAVYDPDTDDLYVPYHTMASILTKELTYVGSKYPIASIIRTRKYVARGWSINAGQYLKMCLQVNDLDLHDIDVLKDQLLGVDSVYFIAFLNAIGDRDIHAISHTELCTMIDQAFDDCRDGDDDAV